MASRPVEVRTGSSTTGFPIAACPFTTRAGSTPRRSGSVVPMSSTRPDSTGASGLVASRASAAVTTRVARAA